MKGTTVEEESPGRRMAVTTHKNRMDSHPKFGLDVDIDDITHTHQEGMKSFMTHIMRLSGRAVEIPSRSENGFSVLYVL